MKNIKPKILPGSRRRIMVGGIIMVMFVWTILSARPFRPVEPIPANIVDMHCHIAGIGAGDSGCFVSPRLLNNWRFSIYLRAFGVTKKEVLEKGDAIIGDKISESLAQSKYVSQAVLLALDGAIGADGRLDTNLTEVYFPNEFVAGRLREAHESFVRRVGEPVSTRRD